MNFYFIVPTFFRVNFDNSEWERFFNALNDEKKTIFIAALEENEAAQEFAREKARHNPGVVISTQRIEITVPSEGVPEERTFTTSLQGLENTTWQEFGIARTSLTANPLNVKRPAELDTLRR